MTGARILTSGTRRNCPDKLDVISMTYYNMLV